MSSFNTIVVEVEARVKRGSAKPDAFGWSVTINPHDDPVQTAAAITEVCRRVRDEAQGKFKL